MYVCMFFGWKQWMDGWMDGWADGWMDGRMDGWMDMCMYGCVHACIDAWMYVCLCWVSFFLFVCQPTNTICYYY